MSSQERRPEKPALEVVTIEIPNRGFRAGAPSLLCPTCHKPTTYEPVIWMNRRDSEGVIFQAEVFAYECKPCESSTFYPNDVSEEINKALHAALLARELLPHFNPNILPPLIQPWGK